MKECSEVKGALPVRGHRQVEGDEEIRSLIRVLDSKNAIQEIIRLPNSLFLNLNYRLARLSS